MSMKFKRLLPIPKDIRAEMPLSAEMAERKASFDADVTRVLRGEDDRLLLIIGPCSADREDSVLDYAARLAELAETVRDRLVVIPRVYTNKPRTKGTGYKGLLHTARGRQGHSAHAPARGGGDRSLHGGRDALSHQLPVPH